MKLIIEGYNKSIHKKGELLQIKEKSNEIYRISPKKISDITLLSKGYITFDALSLISKHNIPVISMNNYNQIKYILFNPQQSNVKLRKAQYTISDNIKGIKISKEIILSKMKNQYATIKTLNKNKKIDSIKNKQNKIKQNIKTFQKTEITDKETIYSIKNKIRAIEGITAYEYWNAIKEILPQDINFKKRNQKPKKDVTNALLNYGYAILSSEITKYIILEKLDPYCGILHTDQNNRQSLTYDLIEEFRQQIVDKTVFSLINKKQITEKDIDQRSNLLKLDTRKLLANKIMKKIHSEITYQENKITYQKIIETQVNKLKNTIKNETEYKGFYLQW